MAEGGRASNLRVDVVWAGEDGAPVPPSPSTLAARLQQLVAYSPRKPLELRLAEAESRRLVRGWAGLK